jgi:hypothetical protein
MKLGLGDQAPTFAKVFIYLTHQSAKPSPLAPLPQERGTRNLIFLPFSCGRRGWGMRGASRLALKLRIF